MLTKRNWRPIAQLEHSSVVEDDSRLVAYSEVSEASSSGGSHSGMRSRYIVCETPLKIQAIKAPQDKPNPRIGVGECLTSRYFLLRRSSSPRSCVGHEACTIQNI